MRVDPIKNQDDIKRIKNLLQSNPRDYLLFTLGINTGLRIGDLLRLKVSDLQNLKIKDSFSLIEEKTGKQNVIVINEAIHKAFQFYLRAYNPASNSVLFFSRKGSEALSVPSVNRIVKGWCDGIGLQGNFGCHTLRKTFGYLMRSVHGVSSEILCTRYNHSSPRVTMLYLGISTDEVNGILMKNL